MDNSVLLRFLNSGLINVGGDDSKLEKLSLAVKDLAGNLKKSPSKALSYSLIAFDPDAPEQDPVVQEVLAVLQSRWTAYRNTFSSTPIVVVRGMLLDALRIAAFEDERVGVCFVASARNVLPLLRADNEREIWAKTIQEIELKVDAKAEQEWATPTTITVPAMVYEVPSIEAPEVKSGKVGRAWLRKEMLAATGPHYSDPDKGSVPTEGNPHWPQNQPQNWAGEFGRRSSAAIAEAIDAVVGGIEITQPDLVEPFKQLAESISTHVAGTLRAVSAATAGLQRRTHLLWWREALYSPSARTSYRKLPVTVAAAQMALDLFNEVPLFSPVSVSAFLQEAVLRLPDVAKIEDRSIWDLVTEAQDFDTLVSLRTTAMPLVSEPEGRGPLLALIAYPSHTRARNKDVFQLLTGIPVDTKLDPVDWAVWIFRELQAAKAAADGSSPKRRAAKKV